MSKNVRQTLLDAAPKPDRSGKDAFIRMYRKRNGQPELGAFDIIKSQFSYIRLPV